MISKNPIKIFAFILIGLLASCQNAQSTMEEDPAIPLSEVTNSESVSEETSMSGSATAPLPRRSGPETITSGTVPHVQIGVELIEEINDQLFQLAFSLPGVENRPTIVSLPGARGMWLSDDVQIVHPEVIVSGREFAHIHPDGSLHVPLPYDRALEAAEKGWAERHPWADQREGWEGLVMLFTPQTMAELDVIVQLIIESYNFVTGVDIQITDLQY